MTTYCIGYDLIKEHKDYEELITHIKQLGTWWHCLDSTWLVVSSLTAVQIRDRLSAHIDNNDKLLIFSVGRNWASMHLPQNCNDWLQANWHAGCS